MIGWIVPVVHKAISLPVEQIKAAKCPNPQPAGAIFKERENVVFAQTG